MDVSSTVNPKMDDISTIDFVGRCVSMGGNREHLIRGKKSMEDYPIGTRVLLRASFATGHGVHELYQVRGQPSTRPK
jgi:hypothetical protein